LISIVDSGSLYAAADRRQPEHERCMAALRREDLELVIPAMVVAEVCHFVGKRLGPKAEARFLKGLSGFDVRAPHPDDWPRIGELVDQYADFPLGGTDAGVVALAERLDADTVITLDRRHFGAVRPRHREALQLLP
jgi:predicted nucleic acid-binding protein